ncbi:MAG: methionine adenosyltransferase [Proteobacteria bacterium]|jgi:S-adenosylmethionine synthetase|nr:methionine adenosyltransferase [Pseudomonadota bacterium]MDA0995881.1 methionine adenosyltransferase [Pseudomonadota bacterium]
MNKNYIFTSESVSEGHPDKVSDIISDTILDLYLSKFNESRVACETLVTTNKVIIAGETRGPKIDSKEIEQAVRDQVRNIGYEQNGFHWKNLEFFNYLHEQSADIAQGVDSSGNEKDEGAGDQGIMFGYACMETKELMPAPIIYSHKILKELAEARKNGDLKLLGPDSKSQISVVYENSKPVGVSSIVISSQHDDSIDQKKVKEMVRPYVKKILPENWICPEDQFYVNPTGKFVIGGPDGDTGLTGRKIIVDTYGGAALHGGGAFSGKDPTKVDRSAAYMARYLAKNIVASGIVDKAVIQLSYAIGVSQPLSIYLDVFQENQNLVEKIIKIIKNNFDLSPRGIRNKLELNKPIYRKTAAYGHFGRVPEADGSFSWEKIDSSGIFKQQI